MEVLCTVYPLVFLFLVFLSPFNSHTHTQTLWQYKAVNLGASTLIHRFPLIISSSQTLPSASASKLCLSVSRGWHTHSYTHKKTHTHECAWLSSRDSSFTWNLTMFRIPSFSSLPQKHALLVTSNTWISSPVSIYLLIFLFSTRSRALWQWASLNIRKSINNAHTACYSSKLATLRWLTNEAQDQK